MSPTTTAIHYYYSGDQIIEERDATDNVTSTYLYGIGVDDILQMHRNGQDYCYHKNHLGSVVALTDGQDSLVERYEYDPYGKLMIYDVNDSVLAFSAVGNIFYFTGREYDFETGLYHYRARAFNPDLGRFMQQDPLLYVDAMGLYHYVGNKPTMMVDPWGVFSIGIHEEILREALIRSGLNKDVTWLFKLGFYFGGGIRADIIGAIEDNHFDNRENCEEVADSWSALENRLEDDIDDVGGLNIFWGGSDVEDLGLHLHNIADFYAHSNYVDLYTNYYVGKYGVWPSKVPTYFEGLKIPDFNKKLQKELRTGDFDILDNEKIDVIWWRESADEPYSHNKMNKDNADTSEGKLAKEAAIEHTTMILKQIKQKNDKSKGRKACDCK